MKKMSAPALRSTPGSGAPTYRRWSNATAYFLPGKLGGMYGQAMVAPGEWSVTVTGQTSTGCEVGIRHRF